jgi:hypothetical protein
VILTGKDCRALFVFTFEEAHGILFIQTVAMVLYKSSEIYVLSSEQWTVLPFSQRNTQHFYFLPDRALEILNIKRVDDDKSGYF